MNQDNSYSRIFKGTMIFGGTQIIQILVKIIRGKLVSILLGAKGMGISSIYISSTQTVVSVASLGLFTSGVRNISEASTYSDVEKQRETLSLINQCFFITYAIGFISTLLLSPLLSLWSFGNYDHTFLYALLSVSVLFELCGLHYTAVLQGMGLIKELASATIWISILTLIISIPLYYFYGIDGIVPAMILGSMANAAIRFLQVRKLKIPFKWHPLRKVIDSGRQMISIGLISLVSIVMGNIVTYVINIFIAKYGSMDDVGFFQAANVIILQSVSMVFASMSADYYPRLAKIANDKVETNLAVNRQTEILCYIAMPILGVMIVASPLVIHLFLSEEFLVITDFIKWISIGTALQVFSYPLGHIAWAKGDTKVLLYLEGIFNSLARLVIYIICYYLGGLEGLGYGLCLTNALYLVVVSVIVNRRYGYVRDTYSKKAFLYLIPLLLAIVLSLHAKPFLYALAVSVVIAMSIVCLYKLNMKLDLVASIKNRLRHE